MHQAESIHLVGVDQATLLPIVRQATDASTLSYWIGSANRSRVRLVIWVQVW
ncbi:MAG TPA: hypothetical protein PKE45_12920 [Caldilineaceae bacterium]|nr:hypothetical protein [Caldilineaceae bacterium]